MEFPFCLDSPPLLKRYFRTTIVYKIALLPSCLTTSSQLDKNTKQLISITTENQNKKPTEHETFNVHVL